MLPDFLPHLLSVIVNGSLVANASSERTMKCVQYYSITHVYSITHSHSFLTQFCECKTANPDRFVRRVISKLTIIIKNFKSMRQKMSVLEMTFRRLTLVSLHFEAIRFHTAQYFSRQG